MTAKSSLSNSSKAMERHWLKSMLKLRLRAKPTIIKQILKDNCYFHLISIKKVLTRLFVIIWTDYQKQTLFKFTARPPLP